MIYQYVDPLDTVYDADKALWDGLRNVFAEPPDIFQIRTLDEACADDIPTKCNIGAPNLSLAAQLFRKVAMAAELAMAIFPQDNLLDLSPAQKTEIVVILAYISQQLEMLIVPLIVARIDGFPVTTTFDFFNRLTDRIAQMIELITDESQFTYKPNPNFNHSRHPSPKRHFGLLDLKMDTWREEYRTNPLVRDYVDCGKEAAEALQNLEGRLSTYLRARAFQVPNDPVGNWLARELDRILSKKGPGITPDHEFAVFEISFRRYRDLVSPARINDPAVQTFFELMRKAQRSAASDLFEKFKFKVCNEFYRSEVLRREQRGVVDVVVAEEEIRNFGEVVEDKLWVAPEVEVQDSIFAKIVRMARSRFPYGKPEEIFNIAERVYFSNDMTLFEEQPAEKPVEVLLVPYVHPTGAKQNPAAAPSVKQREKARDPLRKVKKTISTKTKGKKAGFSPSPLRHEIIIE